MQSKSGKFKWPPSRKIVFPEELKRELRRPLGLLLKGNPPEVVEKIEEIISQERPPILIAVGDFVSRQLSEAKVKVDIYVVDGAIERRESGIPRLEALKTERAVNERGTITPDAAEKLHQLISAEETPSILLVEGEEDLLALSAILSSPLKSIIVYGQPGEGAVLVRVTSELKEKARKIIEEILE